MYAPDPSFVPKTIVDLERGTRDDLIALYKHCMRKMGKMDHIFKDQTKDNKWLIGDDTNFLKVVDDYIEDQGATVDARNVKKTTHLVLQASPEYFRPEYHRDDPAGFGKYDQERLDNWVEANMKWVKKVFGKDCVAAHLHVDERTPHIHLVIVPTFEKQPTMPRKKRKGETDERFAARVERAKKKKSKIVVSHHKHHLFGSGRQSYENVVDSYAEAVEHLGIERGERGSTATPTTKQEWARELVKEAEAKKQETELKILSMQRRQELEEESFEFGSQAVLEEKIEYRAPTEQKPDEGLKQGKNWPEEKVEQAEILEKIKPAGKRITQFAKFVKAMASNSIEKAKKMVSDAYAAVMKREAALDAREKELNERAKQLDIIESLDAEVEDGNIGEADDKKLRDTGIIKDQQTPEGFLKIQEERVLQKERHI